MASMLPTSIASGTGVSRAPDRLHAAGGRQDRHDQRLQRRVVRRLHAAPRDRRLGRLRSAEDDHLERLRRRGGGADLGRLHEAATKGDKPEWFERPANVSWLNVCRMSGKLPNAGCESVQVVDNDGELETRSMIYTRVLRPRHAADDRLPAARLAVASSIGWPACSARTAMPPVSADDRPAARRRREHDRHQRHRRRRPPQRERPRQGARSSEGEEPKKKRGFWSKVFGGGTTRRKRRRGQEADEERKKQEERRKPDEKKRGGDEGKPEAP